MESFFVLFIILLVVYFAILFSKKISDDMRFYPIEQEVNLSSDLSYIVKDINEYKGNAYDYDDKLSRLMSKVFAERISSKYLIAGDDFEPFKDKVSQIYDLRDVIGINGYIAYVENEEDYSFVSQNVKCSNKKLIDKIIDCDLLDSLKKNIKTKLNSRWKTFIDAAKYKLEILNGSKFSVETKDGRRIVRILEEKIMPSYIYLKENIIPNMNLEETKDGFKINLLCPDKEFNTLIKRISDL